MAVEERASRVTLLDSTTITGLAAPESGFVPIVTLIGLLYREVLGDGEIVDHTLPIPGTKLRLIQELANISGLDAVHTKGYVLMFFLKEETWVAKMLDKVALQRADKVNNMPNLPEARRAVLLEDISNFKAAALAFLRDLRFRLEALAAAAATSEPEPVHHPGPGSGSEGDGSENEERASASVPSRLLLSSLPSLETLSNLLQAAIGRRTDHDEDVQGAARGKFEEGVAVAWARTRWPEHRVLPSCVVTASIAPPPAAQPTPTASSPRTESPSSSVTDGCRNHAKEDGAIEDPLLLLSHKSDTAAKPMPQNKPPAPASKNNGGDMKKNGGDTKSPGEKPTLLCTKQEFDALIVDSNNVLDTILEVKAGASLYQDFPKALGALTNIFESGAQVTVKERKGKMDTTKIRVGANVHLAYFFGATGTLQELLQISSTQTELGVMMRSQVLLNGCAGQLDQIRGAKVHVSFHERLVSESQVHVDDAEISLYSHETEEMLSQVDAFVRLWVDGELVAETEAFPGARSWKGRFLFRPEGARCARFELCLGRDCFTHVRGHCAYGVPGLWASAESSGRLDLAAPLMHPSEPREVGMLKLSLAPWDGRANQELPLRVHN